MARISDSSVYKIDTELPTHHPILQVDEGDSVNMSAALPLNTPEKNKHSIHERDSTLVTFAAVLYFTGMGINAVALKLLINERISGDAEHPNSESAFVDTTTTFLRSLASFVMGRYTTGFSDYIGRKPVLIISSISLILSRIAYYFAYTSDEFYAGGVIGGAFDCFYFTSLAWICDLHPHQICRSKRVGMFTGAVGGTAFVVGAPLGAVLATKIGIRLPFVITMFLGAICIVVVVAMPVNDTIGVRKDPSTARHLICGRYLPAQIKHFLIDNFPLNVGSIELMKLSSHPLDWIATFLLQICSSTIFIIFIQFSLFVYGYSSLITAITLVSIGIGLTITSPLLLSRFHAVPVVFYTGMLFSTGLLLLAISGMGCSQSEARVVAIPAIAAIALSVSWAPAYQSIITSQYDSSTQGIVSGMLNQLNDLAIFPGYLISLLFSFSLKTNAVIPWPGSSFAVAALLGYVACTIHYISYRDEALVLCCRKVNNFPGSRILVHSVTLNDDQVVDETPL